MASSLAASSLCASFIAVLALSGCGGDGGGGEVVYSRDIAPLFAQRCVPCHNSGAQGGRRDLEDPFTLDDSSPGLFVATNDWNEGEHGGQSPPYNVVPFHPEESFLMEKITNRNLFPQVYDDAYCRPLARDRSVPLPEACRAYDTGGFMPAQQLFSADKIALIRQWISDGAEDTDFFRRSVYPLFGKVNSYLADPCGYCHYPGGPETPDFTNPFDPVVGIVDVFAHYRNDLKLVEPGNPDQSFLIMKLEATEPSSEIGAPMPRNHTPLNDEQAALVARWISEGAKDN